MWASLLHELVTLLLRGWVPQNHHSSCELLFFSEFIALILWFQVSAPALCFVFCMCVCPGGSLSQVTVLLGFCVALMPLQTFFACVCVPCHLATVTLLWPEGPVFRKWPVVPSSVTHVISSRDLPLATRLSCKFPSSCQPTPPDAAYSDTGASPPVWLSAWLWKPGTVAHGCDPGIRKLRISKQFKPSLSYSAITC